MDIWPIVFSQWTVYLIVILTCLFYRSIRSKSAHILDRGIPFRKATFLGCMGDILFRKISFYEMLLVNYRMFDGNSVYGTFNFVQPILFVRDPELIGQITVKHFDHFVNHNLTLHKSEMEPFLANALIQLRGDKWRQMRSIISPAFTGSKMRYLFQLVDECTQRTICVLRDEVRSVKDTPYVVELKDLFSRFANDVIATAAFGIEVNSVKDANNRFYVMGNKTMDFSSIPFVIRSIFVAMAHNSKLPLPRFLKPRLFSKDKVQFYDSLVHDTIRYREQNGTVRPDMIQLLIEARKNTLVDSEKVEHGKNESKSIGTQPRHILRDDEVTAQCFLFFLAGFETISNALSLLGYELVNEPSVQSKLVQELDKHRNEMNGKPISYDDLGKLKYLDMVVSELLRKWPALLIDRVCEKDVRLSDGSGHTFDFRKDDLIWIPIVGIHRDPQYFEQPDKFDPERFGDERKHEIRPLTYFPFGSGPRNCIGSRFALMELKVFLFHYLGAFTFGIAENTQIPLKIACSGFSFRSERGINIRLVPRVNDT